MIILLPVIQSHHSFAAKIGIILFNWFAWIIPAVPDSVANDVGDIYQQGLVMILVCWLSISLVTLLFGIMHFELSALALIGTEIGTYLLFGLFYHLYQRSWN